MEGRDDLRSILPFLPLILRSSSLFWAPKSLDSLKALSLGPDISRVDSGEVLFDAILDLRDSLGLSSQPLASRSPEGYALFFDELMSRVDSRMWFGDVIPSLARLMLKLPSLLEEHYRYADGEGRTGLRIMGQQEAGIVFLSQELIGALLACAFFCLFPTNKRDSKCLPDINFDSLFGSLHPNAKQSIEQKVKCLIHYFERICMCMPTGLASFERKVLAFEKNSSNFSYPDADFWRKSALSLCPFEVFPSALIEDQRHEALEVDFANEYLGGGALQRGCVQEEIRFMINPELIVGMLFMASMRENEAIEIVGAERFSRYMGYGSSFCFLGDYLDKKPFDSMGRRRTRIIAIDALYSPGIRQYGVECLVRETNKAYCGFFDHSKYDCYLKIFQEATFCEIDCQQDNNEAFHATLDNLSVCNDISAQTESPDVSAPTISQNGIASKGGFNHDTSFDNCQENIGIATGNWGCGAFGGDPQIKSIIQWLAASQALRLFIHYYTFDEVALKRLEEVTRWILLHGWTVGDLWSMLVEYSTQRFNRKTNVGFFNWLLPPHEATDDLQYMSE